MDNKKPQEAASLSTRLFGSNDSSSSNDVLASIFPPSKGVQRNSVYSEVRGSWQNEPSGNQPWNTKQGSKERSSIYEQEGAEPSNLSNSLYYGGRESYPKLSNNQNPISYLLNKEDEEEDNPRSASRGNWWQGSLYY